MGGSMGLFGMNALLHPATAAKTNNARPLASITHLLDRIVAARYAERDCVTIPRSGTCSAPLKFQTGCFLVLCPVPQRIRNARDFAFQGTSRRTRS